MEELLPYYERELSLLQQQAEEFARRHPQVAGRFSASGDLLQDPHVQRLMQSFALLASRVHQRLDDDYPRFTHQWLEQVCPQLLRPYPGCSIACFDNAGCAAQASGAEVLPAGRVLHTNPLHYGVPCSFTTTAPLQLLPLRVAEASFRGAAPGGTALPRQASALLSIRLELLSETAGWDRLGVERIRLFLDGEAPLVNLLRETLSTQVLATLVQAGEHGPWTLQAGAVPLQGGLDDGEALLGVDLRWPASRRLLAEYFVFPEKFNFIELPLPAAARRGGVRTLVLHYALAGPKGGSNEARLLEQVQARHFVPGCTPVVNLFTKEGSAAVAGHGPGRCTVLADAHQAAWHEVFAIDEVAWRAQGEQAPGAPPLLPFAGLRHEAASSGVLYWMARRDTLRASGRPGHEMELSLVNAAMAPVPLQADALALRLRVTNADFASRMPVGHADGDLGCGSGGHWNHIRLLRPPTPSRRFALAQGGLWTLISHLRPNPLWLSGRGLEALKELLRLYDLPRSQDTERLLEGLTAIEHRAAQACVTTPRGPHIVRGTEIRLSVREEHFAGRGLHLFAEVLSRFFDLWAHTNSFTQLRLVSAHSGEVLVACPRREGSVPLL
ncbi:type VI secretion system baseplate subunit TssF [Azohydromonas caseinilytica]|uniref:Type VI secretion system baseplate subunit TssF n=1 Tax=Azohydromonas caseinilytica TaxID=2728836 RepID=A0A848FA06_9BURK|nr:type VI secretion system baseplate subunit TssF [Azohydromonas caseinilytica]NML16374.1 type VI secretion system baseplate subunit TssF [Azohydromonas caseinilytica]